MEAVAPMQKKHREWGPLHLDIRNVGGNAGLPVRLTPYREDVPYGPLAPPLLASWAAEAAVVRAGWAAEARAAATAAASAEAASGSVFVRCKQGANRTGAVATAFVMAKFADDLELTTDSEGEHVPRHQRRAMARRSATASGPGNARATASGHGKK